MKVETDVPMAPEEPVKKKSRARRTAKKKSPAEGLIKALQFLKPCMKKTGTVLQQHCLISNNWVVAANEFLTIGSKIEEDLAGCPHLFQLESALKKIGDEVSIVGTGDSVAVVSGALKAQIPCISFDDFDLTGPDENVAKIGEEIKHALAICVPLATEGHPLPFCASVLLQANTAVASNKITLVEYTHGVNLPPMLIPKASVQAIVKCKKTLVGFGWSGPSATFWFEDGSFIKTQLFEATVTEYLQYLECESPDPKPVPAEFFTAVKAIAEFSKDGFLYFKSGQICSSEAPVDACTYDLEWLPNGMLFNAKLLLQVEKVFKTVYFDEETKQAFFFSDKLRGVIKGAKE